jgi:acyl-CoA thioester hydrolase
MIRLRVRFAETDQMGVAHHGSYAAWLEVARVEWLRERGRSYAALEAEGISLAVSELRVAYRSPARFDDLLCVGTWLVDGGSRGCRFAYRIEHDGSGALVASALTRHVAVDRRGRAVRLTPDWRDFLRGSVEREPG